jgi:hypothetical protein
VLVVVVVVALQRVQDKVPVLVVVVAGPTANLGLLRRRLEQVLL